MNMIEIAEMMGLIVINEELGEVLGFYHEINEFRFLHLNERLNKKEKNIIANNILAMAFANPNKMIVKIKSENNEKTELEDALDRLSAHYMNMMNNSEHFQT